MSTPSSPAPSRWRLWLPVGVAAVFYAAFIARSAFRVGETTYFSLFDDGMISLTYARTLAEGGGLVWQPGAPAVEGYTNFLWTLWMALLHLLPVPEPKIALLVMISGAAILLANLVVVHAIARRVFADLPVVAPLAVWLTALYYPLAYWTLRGMEVGLVALLISAAVLLALRLSPEACHLLGRIGPQDDKRRGRSRGTLLAFGAVMVAGVLTRTDAIVPLGVVAAFAVWQARTAPVAQRVRVAAAGLGVLLATLAGHTLFRVAYYGEALPNTYYLKLGGIALTDRIVRGLASLGWVGVMHLWAAVAIAVTLFVLRRRLEPAAWLLGAVFASQAAYSVYVGGDAWEWMGYANRYLATGAPALLILTAGGIATIARAPRTAKAVVAGALAVLGVIVIAGALRQDVLGLDLLQARSLPALWTIVAAALLPLVVLAATATPGAFHTTAAAVVVAVVLGVNGLPVTEWAATGGISVADDARMTRYALTLRETTEPHATIAVVWAGTIPYFSHRPALDLLGKSDAHIAHLAPLDRPLQPGHVKWDYEYTINQLRPDVVAQVFSPRRQTLRDITGWGYTEVAHRTFVRNDSDAVNVAALRTALQGDPHTTRVAQSP